MIASEGCVFRTQLTHDQSRGRIVKFWFNNCDYNLEKKKALNKKHGGIKIKKQKNCCIKTNIFISISFMKD